MVNFTNENQTKLPLDQRAVLLATAISIDIDYFSRHSNNNHGFLPFGMMGTPVPTGGVGGAPVPVPGVGVPIPGVGMGDATTGAMGEQIIDGAVGGMIDEATKTNNPNSTEFPGSTSGSSDAGTVWGTGNDPFQGSTSQSQDNWGAGEFLPDETSSGSGSDSDSSWWSDLFDD